MKLYLTLLLSFCAYVSYFSQTTYVLGTLPASNGSTVTINCGVVNNFQDPGGASNYGNNQNITVTFCSNSSNPLYFDFRAASNSLNLDSGTGDTLYFYDATTNSLITFLTQSDDYAFSTPSVGTTSSCVKIVWHSNGSVVDGGWDALISCTSPPTCVSNLPAADVFQQAPTICNFSNYCGATDSYYGEDAPYNFSGTGGGCPAPDGLFGGTLENNSWLKFQAVSTTASFNFNVTGGGSCTGLQAGVFDFNPSTGIFTLKSPCAATNGSGLGTGNSTLTATGLVVGNIYYLMMDGTAGSVCNYNVSANTGVALANAGSDQAVCTTSTTLNAATAVGTGTWTVVSGTGTFANSNSNSTSVTGLSAGINIFTWTINTAFCGIMSDNITVNAACLLPIELTRFEGDCFNRDVILTWQTASEKNNNVFNIERSSDALHFETIYSINGAGNSNTSHNYTYIDHDDFDGITYYRLTQVDFDGTISQSKIISVSHFCDNKTQAEITIYPNPSYDDASITIKLIEQSIVSFCVYNSIGQLMTSVSPSNYEPGLEKIDFGVNNLAKGIYYIKATINDRDTVLKFIKL